MSLSTDCRVASLIAFSEARAMGTGTNAGGGATTGAADCGRDDDGKFGGGNKCQTAYHGTNADDPHSLDFKEVSQSKNSYGMFGDVDVTRHGIFFSDSEDFSSEYGKNVGEFSLDAKKIADLTPVAGYQSDIVSEFVDSLDAFGAERDVWMTAKFSAPQKPWLLFDDTVGKKFTSWLKLKGYNGAKFPEYTESADGKEKSGTTFVVFDKSKIKPKKSSRAFCPTGPDGGVDNSCSAATASSGWKKTDGPVVARGEDAPSKSLQEVQSVSITSGRLVSKTLRNIGVSLDEAAKACASISPDADIIVNHGDAAAYLDQLTEGTTLDEPQNSLTFGCVRPIGEGLMTSIATIKKEEDDKLVLDYRLFGVTDEAQRGSPVAVARELYRGVFDSITNAESIGVSQIRMTADGSDKDAMFKGYRLWPRLGFDGVIPRAKITPTYSLATGFFNPYGSSLPTASLSPRARAERAAGALTVQALYETKAGQDWWEKHGSKINLTLTVGDESSPGWKRFQSLRGKLVGRSIDILEALGVESRAFCPTGEGGGLDNSCGKSPTANGDGRERLQGTRNKKGKQTEVARKINQMQSSEKQIEQLVRDLGGSVKHSLLDIQSTRGEEGLNIFVRDADLNENFYIHFGYYGATVYSTDKLTEKQSEDVKSAAEKAFPKAISDRLWARGKPYPIYVANPDEKKDIFSSGKKRSLCPTESETNLLAGDNVSDDFAFDARLASLLAFAEARNCGNGPGGFQTGNTCAKGAAADAAKGAVAGAVKGAVTGLVTGGPAAVKPGAAIGAAYGAVKGVYDNQMRPTRVKNAIDKVGSSEVKIASLVKSLGGTKSSSANVKGGKLTLTIRNSSGKKTFHVEMTKDKITFYPRRATGQLTDKEISRIKGVAKDSFPKSVSIVVKNSSSAYVARLVKNGFSVAAGAAADVLAVSYIAPVVDTVVGDIAYSLKKKR